MSVRAVIQTSVTPISPAGNAFSFLEVGPHVPADRTPPGEREGCVDVGYQQLSIESSEFLLQCWTILLKDLLEFILELFQRLAVQVFPIHGNGVDL
jgi:hypothetical protein